MDDAKIIALYLSRDEKAVSETEKKYGKRLAAIAGNVLDDARDVEEIVNDTYHQAWRLIPPNEPRDFFFAFLSRITRNLALDRCRENNAAKRTGVTVELTDELAECTASDDDVEQTVEETELYRQVSAFLRTLPKDRRIIFLRRYYYMQSVSEIAADLHVSESRVKTTLFRQRQRLRTYLIKGGFIT